jgi:hexaprenyl-diphosphate synthase
VSSSGGSFEKALTASSVFAPTSNCRVSFSLADFEGSASLVGKPVLNDIKQGLATGPVLFAAEQFPAILPCIERKFEAPGDVDMVLKYVQAADGVTATRRLAVAHGQAALDALNDLSPGPARTALAALVMRVLNREA